MSRGEWRWVLVASLAVVLFSSLPVVYAWANADEEHVFSGFVFNAQDGHSYVGKMRLGARGEWLFHLFYTTEPHEPALMFPFYLLLGKGAATTGLPYVAAYHLARIVFGAGLLVTAYLFLAHFMTGVSERRIAWLLVSVGSGLGWLLVALGAANWLGWLPLDLWVPEAYVFLVVYGLPHLALAQSLLLWALLLALQSASTGNLGKALLAGAATFVLSWIVPFFAGPLAGALAIYLLASMVRQRRIAWREVGLMLLVGLFAAPSLAYNAWVFTANPAFQAWAAQKGNASPHPLSYLLGHIWLIVPAAWTATALLRRRRGSSQSKPGQLQAWLPLLWAAMSLGMAYVPFVSQRRLVVLLQISLAIPAAHAVARWSRRRSTGAVAYVAMASITNVLLLAGTLGPIQRRESPIYLPAGEVAALRWLGAEGSAGEAVLSTYAVGNVIPAWTDLRVYIGHGPETLDYGRKEDSVRVFFQASTEDSWREALLAEHSLDYVFYGPEERALGAWDPSGAGYLATVYAREGYVIYEVVGGEQP